MASLAENVTSLQQTVVALQAQLLLLQSNTTEVEAEIADELHHLENEVDIFWMLYGALLLLFMQVGYMLIAVAGTSARNTKFLLVRNVLESAAALLAWWTVGYGIAMGENHNEYLGHWFGRESFFTNGDVFHDAWGHVDVAQGFSLAVFLVQGVLSSIASSVVNGACGERITLSACMVLSWLTGSFIYPISVRWARHESGWASPNAPEQELLFGCGVTDHAGGATIHIASGFTALITIIALKPRLGRFASDGTASMMAKQSSTLGVLGTFIVFVGFGGYMMSATSVSENGPLAAHILVVLVLSASAGCLSTATMGYLYFGHVYPEHCTMGILAGLVSVTSGVATIETEAAIIIGALGGFIALTTNHKLLEMEIDDAISAVPVHLMCGLWSVVAAGLFSTQELYSSSISDERSTLCCGFLFGCGGRTLAANLVFVFVLCVGIFVMLFLVIETLKKLKQFRVPSKSERAGMDRAGHGGEEVPEHVLRLAQQMARLGDASKSSGERGRIMSGERGRMLSNAMLSNKAMGTPMSPRRESVGTPVTNKKRKTSQFG